MGVVVLVLGIIVIGVILDVSLSRAPGPASAGLEKATSRLPGAVLLVIVVSATIAVVLCTHVSGGAADPPSAKWGYTADNVTIWRSPQALERGEAGYLTRRDRTSLVACRAEWGTRVMVLEDLSVPTVREGVRGLTGSYKVLVTTGLSSWCEGYVAAEFLILDREPEPKPAPAPLRKK